MQEKGMGAFTAVTVARSRAYKLHAHRLRQSATKAALCATFVLSQLFSPSQGRAQAPRQPPKQDSELTGRADSAADRAPFASEMTPETLVPLLPDDAATRALHAAHLRLYGWVDGGFTYSSAGNGELPEAPTPNRFGKEFSLNGAWLIFERTIPIGRESKCSWGFRTDFYAGSDAALLRPLNSFGPTSSHLGTDFRQAYLTLHTPGLNRRGIDFTLGRQNVPIGFETLMAPYRPMYSEGYFWIKYEVGSTAALAAIHPTGKLDAIGGVVLGYNTDFELRGRAPAYVARVLYRPKTDQGTQLIATVFTGPQPAPTTAGHLGLWQTVSELQARQVWSPRIHQVFQVHYVVDVRDAATQRASPTQGAFVLTMIKLKSRLFLNTREEWFSDPRGVRNEEPGTYSEAALGVNAELRNWLNFRPEIRGDFAAQPSFQASLGGTPRRNQLTVAFDLVVKFGILR